MSDHVFATDQSTHERLDRILEKLIAIEYQMIPNEPQDYDRPIADTQEFRLELFGLKHAFLLPSNNMTLVIRGIMGANVTIPVTTGVWQNISFPEGTVIATSGQATPVFVHIRATDEIIP